MIEGSRYNLSSCTWSPADRWKDARRPPSTRIVVSNKFTSVSGSTAKLLSIQFRASRNSSRSPMMSRVSRESVIVSARLNQALCVLDSGFNSSSPHAKSLQAVMVFWLAQIARASP